MVFPSHLHLCIEKLSKSEVVAIVFHNIQASNWCDLRKQVISLGSDAGEFVNGQWGSTERKMEKMWQNVI